MEIPESISVITRDRLDRQVITDSLTDILAYVPGVLAAPFGVDSRVDRFTIRGFDAAAFGLYRDKLQLPSFGDPDRSFRIEPYGIKTFEILRGPASVLYDNGSPGGLVNAITKRRPGPHLPTSSSRAATTTATPASSTSACRWGRASRWPSA